MGLYYVDIQGVILIAVWPRSFIPGVMMFSALGLSAINLSLISAVLLLTLSGINYRIDYRRDLDFGNDGCTSFFF